jgi:hypothetical protein
MPVLPDHLPHIHQHADASRAFGLLRTRGNRPRNRRAANKCDELAPPHAFPWEHAYAGPKDYHFATSGV